MKKYLALLLALCMIFSLAACGQAAKPAASGDLVGVAMPTKDLQRWNQDGENMKAMLEKAGYAVDLQYGANDIATQVSQIENMIANGCKVLVIASIDGDSLGTVLAQAKEKNIPVIAYDRLIMNSDAVSYYATFDNWLVGTKQGEFIEEQLGLKDGKGPFNIEFITGDPGDNNINFFFDGAMSILQKYLDNGQLVCPSGQTEKAVVATANWATDAAQARFENILSSYYADKDLDAVLASNDSTACGVENALASSYSGKWPVITGQDCDIAIMGNLIAGKQGMSVFKDTRTLAAKVVEMVDALMKGQEPPINDTETYNNGVGVVPSFLCEPVACTVDNYKELLIDSGYYTLAQLGIEEGAAPAAAAVEPDLSYTIRIYSNSNSTERVEWLIAAAADAGFTISLDTNEVYSGDSAAVQAADENKDGDLIFGLNETRWSLLVNGKYENLKVMDWTPSWADEVGEYKYDGKAYGIVIQNVLMLYRNDELGTNGEELHFDHWADVVDSGYAWYRQNKVGGTTNANINSAILYPFADPASPAGGVSVDGWKTLWKFCADGKFGGDDWKYGIDPLIRGDVAITEYYSSSLYGSIDTAADVNPDNPLRGTYQPENWALVDIKDGTYYIAEYLGILDRAGRSAEETAAVKAFCEWFGSAEVQAAWGDEFDSFPCNKVAAEELYPDGIPAIYQIPNFALTKVDGTDMTYAEYVAAHSAEWTNILTNLGFYWKEADKAKPEPDWDSLDWSVLTQKQGE